MRTIYVLLNGGWCVAFRLRKGQKRVSEYPYRVADMIRCRRKHPHAQPAVRKRRRR